MFQSAEIVGEDKLHLQVGLSRKYYPDELCAHFEIRWYRNDEFNVHYQETRQDSTWKCRWDRHLNAHNSREHFHPPPAASRTDAEDAQWPDDHRDVSRLAIDRVAERVEKLWERQ